MIAAVECPADARAQPRDERARLRDHAAGAVPRPVEAQRRGVSRRRSRRSSGCPRDARRRSAPSAPSSPSIRAYIREYAHPLVATARVDPAAARSTVSPARASAAIDAVRAQFRDLDRRPRPPSPTRAAGARATRPGRLARAARASPASPARALLILAFVRLPRPHDRDGRPAGMAAEAEQLERRVDINRALLDASVDGICLIDMEGRTLLANSVIERLDDASSSAVPSDATLHESLRDRRASRPTPPRTSPRCRRSPTTPNARPRTSSS